MDLNRTPAEISRAMAEEARALNHRTIDGKVFETPIDIAYTAEGIMAVVQRLPQALQQLEAGLEILRDSNRIRLADRHPSEVTNEALARAVATVLVGLQDARAALGTVEEHLQDANRVLSNLGAPWPDNGDDQD
ncbi:hypothetical protein ACF1GW_38640 [Streptomyces achromogenes]|uniref:hypothetical protein n=1 Tax=Streptomyces achromogenes TaxID=67255 RepID=UPI0037008254